MAYLSRNADFLAEKVVMSPGALFSNRVNVDITAALRNDFYTTDWLQVLHPGYLNDNRNIGVYRGQKVVNANIDAFVQTDQVGRTNMQHSSEIFLDIIPV